MTRRDKDPREGGFTLIEIVIVLVIIALAYGLVTPAFSNFFSGNRLDGAAREISLALREARSLAIVTGREFDFQIEQPLEGVTVTLETPGDEPVITFYPGGHSTGGRVRLESDGRGRIIEIHWLTGRVTQTAY